MRSKQSTTYDTKTGYIKRIDIKIYPENLTLLDSSKGWVYLLEAIEDALIKDNKRALAENATKINKGK